MLEDIFVWEEPDSLNPVITPFSDSGFVYVPELPPVEVVLTDPDNGDLMARYVRIMEERGLPIPKQYAPTGPELEPDNSDPGPALATLDLSKWDSMTPWERILLVAESQGA